MVLWLRPPPTSCRVGAVDGWLRALGAPSTVWRRRLRIRLTMKLLVSRGPGVPPDDAEEKLVWNDPTGFIPVVKEVEENGRKLLSLNVYLHRGKPGGR